MADNLYCPRCSNRFSIDTSYCRSCGVSLDGVSKIVTGEASSAPEIQTRPNFKLFRLGIGLFIFGLVVGMIHGALKDYELYPSAYGKTLFLVIVAAGMLLLGSGFVFPTKKYKKRKATDDVGDVTAAPDTSSLVAQLDAAKVRGDNIDFPKDNRQKVPVGSVTEHTTRNLE